MVLLACVACGGGVANPDPSPEPSPVATNDPPAPNFPVTNPIQKQDAPALVCRVGTGALAFDTPCARSEQEWSWVMCPESTCAQVETCNRAIYLHEATPGISFCRINDGRMGVVE